MNKHFLRAVEGLERNLLKLGAVVEDHLHQGILSLETRDTALAQKIMDGDEIIDEMEVEIEEECQKILALHQPVANDLRFIIAALKINNDLERIGDLIVNIAERAIFLSQNPVIDVPLDFGAMSNATKKMLRVSIDAMVQQDTKMAIGVCDADDEVDAMNREMFIKVQKGIQENPQHVEILIHLLSISRHLERIADLATNIAEEVIYMINGDIVRHRVEEYELLMNQGEAK